MNATAQKPRHRWQRPSTIIVTDHAVQQYRNRSGCNKSDEKVRDILLTKFGNSEEVRLKGHYGVIALINHGFKPARYFRSGGFIIVLEDNLIKTIHCGEARRWVRL